jgi:hypothetical protein
MKSQDGSQDSVVILLGIQRQQTVCLLIHVVRKGLFSALREPRDLLGDRQNQGVVLLGRALLRPSVARTSDG